MEKLLTSLNSLYGKLSAKQADYLAMDTSKPEWGGPNFCNSSCHVVILREHKMIFVQNFPKES